MTDRRFVACDEYIIYPRAWDRRPRLWPFLVLVFVIALLASTLTLALSALSSTQPLPGGSVASDPGARIDGGSAVRASAATHQEDLPGPLSLEGESGLLRAATTSRAEPDSPRGASRALRAGSDARAHRQDSDIRKSDIEILAIIRAAAVRHGLDPDELVAVARCESTLHRLAIGRAQELGIFQWKPTSWQQVARASGIGYSIERIFDIEAQAELAAWGIANGYRSWWSCAR